jgi:hypothetical protein
LFAILLVITVTAGWAHYTVLNEKGWVDTVKPIASDPAVTAALSREITDELFAALKPRQAIADALPQKAMFLAAPIATGVHGFIEERVNAILNSPKFQQLWVSANRIAHARLVKVLHGDNKALSTTNGQVVLNLVPALNSVLGEVQGLASNVVGKKVTLPTITADEVPTTACKKISDALNRPLPPTCGQIALFPAGNLTQAQRGVRAFDRGVVALLIVTPLLAVAALLLSVSRRRTLLQLSIAGILGLVILRRSTIWLQSELIAGARPENKAARSAIVHGAVHGLFTLTVWFLIGLLVITVIALLAGPYPWAVALRSWMGRAGHVVASGFSGSDQGDDSAVSWIRAHIDLLRIAGAAVAALVVLLVSLPFWGFLIVVAVLALYEFWLYRLNRTPTVAV